MVHGYGTKTFSLGRASGHQVTDFSCGPSLQDGAPFDHLQLDIQTTRWLGSYININLGRTRQQ